MDQLFVIQRVFREIFDDDALVISVETSPLAITDWDSVAQVKLVLALESEFQTRFTTAEVAKFKNVGDFLRALESRGQ